MPEPDVYLEDEARLKPGWARDGRVVDMSCRESGLGGNKPISRKSWQMTRLRI